MKLIKYKLYCVSEETYKYWYLPDDEAAPTKCPDTSNHTIDPSSVSSDKIIDTDVVATKAVLSEVPMNMRSFGVCFTAPAGETEIHEAVIDESRYFKGGRILTENQAMGDTVDVEVVDKDNVLGYGAGVVLAKYAMNWNVTPSGYDELEAPFLSDNPAVAGLYVRVTYRSVGGTDVKVGLNFPAYKS